MILQLNNLYLPSEEFTSCDTVTPFEILFSDHIFFRFRDQYPVRGIAFNLYGKVNFYCWPSEKHLSKIKIENGI